jgi:hypothetical protein
MPWVDEAASDDEGTFVVGDAKQRSMAGAVVVRLFDDKCNRYQGGLKGGVDTGFWRSCESVLIW